MERFGIDHTLVEFNADGTLNPEIDYDGPIITNGSVALSRLARSRGWRPGSFLNDNFSYEVWQPHFAPWLLNRDAVFTRLGSIRIVPAAMFIRAVLDDKILSGKVMTPEQIYSLRDAALSDAPTAPPPDTQVLLAAPKAIGQEHRHYIVDGRIVSSSRYKLNGTANFSEGADPAVLDFAARMIQIWQPAKAFVLDTYVAGDEIGIVELGCLTHAGLYASDVQRIVMALHDAASSH